MLDYAESLKPTHNFDNDDLAVSDEEDKEKVVYQQMDWGAFAGGLGLTCALMGGIIKLWHMLSC